MDKRTDFEVSRAAVIDDGDIRYVEIELTRDLMVSCDPPQEYIRVRIGIQREAGARVEEAHLEALRLVRNAIGDETARLTRTVDQGR